MTIEKEHIAPIGGKGPRADRRLVGKFPTVFVGIFPTVFVGRVYFS